jgi:hypothetical protein
MSKKSDDDKSKWDQMLESVDLLFDRMNDINLAQQDLKKQVLASIQKVDQFAAHQDLISQLVKANEQAMAQLTLQQFDREDRLFDEGSSFEVVEEEEEDFQNVFGKAKSTHKPSIPSSTNTQMNTTEKMLYLITHYPRCNSQHLMEIIQKSGLITVRTTSQSTIFLRSCRPQQHPCICKIMQPNGGKLISKRIGRLPGKNSVWLCTLSLTLMIADQPLQTCSV